MPRVAANGIHIPFIESGAGEPLILIHGGQSDRFQFDVFRPLLGEGIRAIAYDQRDSPEVPFVDAYGMEDHAADCAAFIAAIGLEKAHLMGTSYGGAIAMMVAINFPHRVQSLTVAASTPSWDMAEPVAVSATAELDRAAIERFMLEQSITPDAVDSDPTLVAEYRAAIRPRRPDSLRRRMGAIRAHDCRSRLVDIRCPTLVLHGDEDPIINARTGEWTAAQIPGAAFVLLSGSRHGVTIQHRQRTADLVRAFVLRNRLPERG